MTIRRLRRPGVAALVLALAACRETPPGRARVRVAFTPYFSQAPILIAREEGYFAREGIDVELVPIGRTTSAATAALLSGGLDVATGAPRIAEFSAIARGAPIRFVADKGHAGPGECSPGAFVARPDLFGSDGRIPASRLRGASVRTQTYTYFEFLLSKALSAEGLALSDVRPVAIPTALALGALEARKIALAYLAEAELAQALREGQVVWKSLSEIAPRSEFSALLFGPRLLERDRPLGVRFLAAYLRGVRRYNEGKTPRNVEALVRLTRRKPEDVTAACWTPIRGDGAIVAPDWEEFQAWAVSRGQMPGPVPLSRLIDTDLLRAANERLAGEGAR